MCIQELWSIFLLELLYFVWVFFWMMCETTVCIIGDFLESVPVKVFIVYKGVVCALYKIVFRCILYVYLCLSECNGTIKGEWGFFLVKFMW